MSAVAIKNVADEVPVNACIVHSDQYPAILEAAVIIGCVFFLDAMLRQHFVQAAPDSSKNSAKADRFRNSRSGDDKMPNPTGAQTRLGDPDSGTIQAPVGLTKGTTGQI